MNKRAAPYVIYPAQKRCVAWSLDKLKGKCKGLVMRGNSRCSMPGCKIGEKAQRYKLLKPQEAYQVDMVVLIQKYCNFIKQ